MLRAARWHGGSRGACRVAGLGRAAGSCAAGGVAGWAEGAPTSASPRTLRTRRSTWSARSGTAVDRCSRSRGASAGRGGRGGRWRGGGRLDARHIALRRRGHPSRGPAKGAREQQRPQRCRPLVARHRATDHQSLAALPALHRGSGRRGRPQWDPSRPQAPRRRCLARCNPLYGRLICYASAADAPCRWLGCRSASWVYATSVARINATSTAAPT